MAQADSETTTPKNPDAERTVVELCHEWKIVDAKLKYDLACHNAVDADDDDGTNRLCTAANDRQHEIEEELADRRLMTAVECGAVLGIVLRNFDEYQSGEDSDREMLKAVRRGLAHIDMLAEGGPAAEALMDVVASEREARAHRLLTQPS